MIDITNGYYQSNGFSLQIDLKLAADSFCAVLGPSGAGKSTLLSVIAGFENLHSGRVVLSGADATMLPASQRPVSMVFQTYNSFAHLDVWTNVALGVSPNLKLSTAQKDNVEQALMSVGLLQLARRKPTEISGGELQRIALARVLVRKKPILLLDEPFVALDPGLRMDMLDLVVALQKTHRLCVLMVTHQPEDAKYAASTVCFVNDGKVQNAVSLAQFFTVKSEAVQRYLGKRS